MVIEALCPLCQLLITELKIEAGVIAVGSEPRGGAGKGPLSVPRVILPSRQQS